MLAIEPTGDLALPDRFGVRFLGMEATRRPGWRSLRHVFEVGGEDGALYVDVGPLGDPEAYAVGFTALGDELLSAL